jgi:lysophospholipase L1-like esterase
MLAALLESVFAVLLAHRLAGTDKTMANLYRQVFREGIAGSVPGSSAYYRGHHYLNFMLNADASYVFERQFNAQYGVRRKEEIRPKRAITWRALALGGSTTFGENTAREEDTWVYRLEGKLRSAHGPAYDVINGGVGGYNVIENLLHYELLLEDLDPDLVMIVTGINDVHPRLMGDITRDYSNSRLSWRPTEILPVANPLLAPFSAYRYFTLLRLQQRGFPHIFQFIQKPYPPLEEWAPALRRNGPQVYQAHLEDLVRLILAQGRKVLIVPQMFIPLSDPTFKSGVDEHNAVNEAVARSFGVPFVSAAVDPAIISRADLIDACHFNAKGHEKMATLLFRFLISA